MTLSTQTRQDILIALPSVGDEEWVATRECFETGWLTQGPKVAAFEDAFAKRHRVAHALAVSSCTTGLHLALLALDIGPGDEVIVPAFTWVATANVVLYCGATPVLADIDPRTFNIDPEQVAQKLTANTKAIIAVHLFGRCADMDALRKTVPPHIAIIEDAACAVGAEYKATPAGSLGDIGVFSFHPRKIITTGEGGMITTQNADVAKKIAILRSHGASESEEQRHIGNKPYLMPDFNLLGFNYRMTDLQGAVGLVQLGKLDHLLQGREQLSAYYQQALSEIPGLQLPTENKNERCGWQSYVCLLDPASAIQRNDIMEALHHAQIATRPGTHAIHMLGLYQQRFGFHPEDFPIARLAAEQSIALPLHNQMTLQDATRVVDALQRILTCVA